MGKKTFLGVSSKAHTVKKLYLGVSGKAHKVKKGFIGVGNKAHQFYNSSFGGTFFIIDYLAPKKVDFSTGSLQATLSNLPSYNHYAHGDVEKWNIVNQSSNTTTVTYKDSDSGATISTNSYTGTSSTDTRAYANSCYSEGVGSLDSYTNSKGFQRINMATLGRIASGNLKPGSNSYGWGLWGEMDTIGLGWISAHYNYGNGAPQQVDYLTSTIIGTTIPCWTDAPRADNTRGVLKYPIKFGNDFAFVISDIDSEPNVGYIDKVNWSTLAKVGRISAPAPTTRYSNAFFVYSG